MTVRLRRLLSIASLLSTDRQQELLEHAEELLDRQTPANPPRFFICPVCFAAAKKRVECHGHLMIPCHADSPEECRPLFGADGELKSRAPRWFLHATTWLSD